MLEGKNEESKCEEQMKKKMVGGKTKDIMGRKK
jgi:hypothetical protein